MKKKVAQPDPLRALRTGYRMALQTDIEIEEIEATLDVFAPIGKKGLREPLPFTLWWGPSDWYECLADRGGT
jgi:hypothetical protein